MRTWYYVEGGEKKGPVDENELVSLFKSSALSPDTLIWSEGMRSGSRRMPLSF